MEFSNKKEFFSASPSRRRETYIKSNFPEIYDELQSELYKDFESFSDKMNKYVFGGGYCVVCNTRTKKETGASGFRKTCSVKCGGIIKQGQEAHNKSDIDEELVKTMYVEELKSPQEIGNHFNVSNVTINKIIEKLCIKRSHSEQQKIHSLKGRTPWNSNEFDKELATDLEYIVEENKTKSIASIANKIGCSPSLLYQLLKANDIKVNNLTKTKPEILIHELLDSLNVTYIENYRDGKEIDIFIPSLNIGIEVDGVYWHCEKYRDSKYHVTKSNYFAERKIEILHFWDFEIIDNFEIVSSMIKNKLKIIDNKIYAKDCEIRDVNTTDAMIFCNENHLHKFVGSNIKKGLFYQNELVAIAMFTSPRYYKNADLELTRFCTLKDTIVVGGFSKIINSMKTFSIVSYVNKRYSTGKSYKINGFKELYETQPNYFYYDTRSGEITNKLSMKKSYKELQKENIYRVFDCGNLLFVKNKKSTQ